MKPDLAETAELQAFVCTVDAKSLARAALELGVPRPTLSRRLARLEERLGVRLLRRTTRRMALTDAGQELYVRASAVLASIADAQLAVQRGSGQVAGLLRLSVPPLNTPLVTDMLLAFTERYPLVRLEVHATTEHIDLVASGYDVAIRAGHSLDPGLVARTLGRSQVVAVASPAYLAARGMPTTAEELGAHSCLLGFARGERPATHWPLRGGGQVKVEGVLVSNELALLLAAAVAGRGIALLPKTFAAEALTSGALVRILPDVGGTSRLAVVFPEREFQAATVRAFTEFLLEQRWGDVFDDTP